MNRPTFNAVAIASALRDGVNRTLEVNLQDAKGNTQTVLFNHAAISHLLGAVMQKRMADPTKDFFLDEAIPIAGLGLFHLPDGHAGVRLYMNPQEVFDIAFAPQTQDQLRGVFRAIADLPPAPTPLAPAAPATP
jgi:hypothetical protein